MHRCNPENAFRVFSNESASTGANLGSLNCTGRASPWSTVNGKRGVNANNFDFSPVRSSHHSQGVAQTTGQLVSEGTKFKTYRKIRSINWLNSLSDINIISSASVQLEPGFRRESTTDFPDHCALQVREQRLASIRINTVSSEVAGSAKALAERVARNLCSAEVASLTVLPSILSTYGWMLSF